jgi:hypothetical protein
MVLSGLQLCRSTENTPRDRTVRGHLINTTQEDQAIQANIRSLEEVYRARLSAEAEKLAGVDIFGQYPTDAMGKIQELHTRRRPSWTNRRVRPPLYLSCLKSCAGLQILKTVQTKPASNCVISCQSSAILPKKCNFLPAVSKDALEV